MSTHPTSMKRVCVQLLLGCVMASASLHAYSAGWINLFRGTPVEDFDDEDLRRMLDAIKLVLGDPKPADVVQWKNAATGSGGDFKIVGEPVRSGYDACRRVKFNTYSKKRKGYATTWTACKEPGGKWVLAAAK